MPDREPKSFRKESLSVADMVDAMQRVADVTLYAVNDVDASQQLVTEPNLHRPGLALAGYTDLFTYQRVQVLGNTENEYLQHLDDDAQEAAFLNLLQFPIPCIILPGGNALAEQLVVDATKQGVPIFASPLPSTQLMARLSDFLDDQFALQQSVHGSLVDVYGIGLLIVGRAGIGKSEISLDLVERGHRLVADDVVIVTRKGTQVLMGSGTDLVQHFMEIRGLGLVDVKAMFGVRAIRYQKRVEVVVQLEEWNDEEEYTRLGMIEDTRTILDIELPKVRLPITPGKNVTVLCEVIAMSHLLRHYGYDPAEVFAKRLADRIRQKSKPGLGRGVEYFEHDYE